MSGVGGRTLLLAAAALGLACGGEAWAAYAEIEVKSGGSVTGALKWSGDLPPEKMIAPATDTKVCHVHADQALVIDKETLGVKNALVSLSGIKKGKKFASRRITLGQKDCIFTPRVIVVPTNGEVAYTSSDTVTHNVHTITKRNRSFNLIVPPRASGSDEAEPLVRRVVRPDRIEVKCDIHSWMRAWIRVTRHPYVVVTDEKGRFSITDIPPGTYKIRVWHEQGHSRTRTENVPMLEFDRKKQDVTIEGGKTALVNFTAKLKESD